MRESRGSIKLASEEPLDMGMDEFESSMLDIAGGRSGQALRWFEIDLARNRLGSS